MVELGCDNVQFSVDVDIAEVIDTNVEVEVERKDEGDFDYRVQDSEVSADARFEDVDKTKPRTTVSRLSHPACAFIRA